MNNISNSYEKRLFRIRVLSQSGDKIHLKFPVEFIKRMIKINGFNWLNIKSDMIDTENLVKMVVAALDSKLTGEIAHIETKNSDSIRIIID
ncbi:MAG: hypothetical protein ACRCXT_01415 [Paraclostridium sp.]